jgi:DNA-binding NtrC family response regulator
MARKRSTIAGLSRLLAAYPQPVYALDERRRVVYYNDAFVQWIGQAAGGLIGKRCDYHSSSRSDGSADPLGGLCPPPETFLGRVMIAQVACREPAGGWLPRPAVCLPFSDGTGALLGVLVVVHDQARLPDAAPSVEDSSPAELHQRLWRIMQDVGATYPLNQVVGESPAIQRVREQVRLAAGTDTRVLVVGPAGSGREHMARAIHYGGAPAASPLTPLACNLLDSELLETTITAFIASCAELQIERPAALLLLEVDQLQPDAQAVLAGILSIGELNVRTIATARRPLIELADQDGFRQDLAYALSTLVIHVPPLAERTQDVPLLAQYFLERSNAAGGRQLSGFSAEALDQLISYPWPENVDELAELVQQACVTAAGPLIQANELPEKIRVTAAADAHPPRAAESIVLDEFLAEVERELLERALQQSKGNKARAARLLGMTRPRFLRRLEHHGIE